MSLPLKDTMRLEARVLDQNGEPLAAAVHWSSSDPRVLRVDSAGSVTGLTLGVAFARASVSRPASCG